MGYSTWCMKLPRQLPPKLDETLLVLSNYNPFITCAPAIHMKFYYVVKLIIAACIILLGMQFSYINTELAPKTSAKLALHCTA